MEPAQCRRYEGNLYQVRRKGQQPYPAAGIHIDRNGKDAFEEIKPLYVDSNYDGDSPAYWRAGKTVYSASYDREKLEQKHPDKEIEALRFRGDIEQRSLQEMTANTQ